MIKCSIYNPGSDFHREALIFSFMPVIQAQLNDFVCIWNIREIRKCSTSSGGVPEIFFNAPSTVGFDKKRYSVDDLDLPVAQDIMALINMLFASTTRCINLSYVTLLSINWKFHVIQRTLLLFMKKFCDV